MSKEYFEDKIMPFFYQYREQMLWRMDITSYDDVKANAVLLCGRIDPSEENTDNRMPPPPYPAFSQELFDLICSDLGSYPVARAVTASSAVPVAFPTIVLENHADHCDISDTWEWKTLTSTEAEGEAQATLLEGLKSYRDVENRKYIHLVDSGIADNLGLRTLIDRVEGLGEKRFPILQEHGVRNILIVLVNA